MATTEWSRYDDDERDTICTTDAVSREEYRAAGRSWFGRFLEVEYPPANAKHERVHGFMFRSDGVNGLLRVAAINERKRSISEYVYTLRLPQLLASAAERFDEYAQEVAEYVIEVQPQDFFDAHRYHFANDLGQVVEIDF